MKEVSLDLNSVTRTQIRGVLRQRALPFTMAERPQVSRSHSTNFRFSGDLYMGFCGEWPRDQGGMVRAAGFTVANAPLSRRWCSRICDSQSPSAAAARTSWRAFARASARSGGVTAAMTLSMTDMMILKMPIKAALVMNQPEASHRSHRKASIDDSQHDRLKWPRLGDPIVARLIETVPSECG